MPSFSSAAACRPAQAEALNDLSSMPPVSVTMQAVYFLPPSAALFSSGASPQAAALRTSPLAANTETIRIPR